MANLPVRKVSDILSSIFSGQTLDKAEAWSEFFIFWKEAAGETLSVHSKAVDIRNGLVIVEAEHPAWINMLQMRQSVILKAIQKKFPQLGVSGIVFKVASDASLPGTAQQTFTEPDVPEIEPYNEASASEVLSTVTDPKFKEQLKSLEKALKSRHKL